MLAKDLPDGEQRGMLTYVRRWCDYVEFASLASAHGVAGFGDTAFTVSCALPNVTLTPPGGHGTSYVSPTPAGVLARANEIYEGVSGELGPLALFYSRETRHTTAHSLPLGMVGQAKNLPGQQFAAPARVHFLAGYFQAGVFVGRAFFFSCFLAGRRGDTRATGAGRHTGRSG